MTVLVALHQAYSKWLHIFLEHSMKGKFAPVPCEVPFPYPIHISNASGSEQRQGKKVNEN